MIPAFLSSKPPETTFKLINEAWESGIWIEIKQGRQSACADMPGGERHFVKHKEDFSLTTTNEVCWRRESNPGDGKPEEMQNVWNHESSFGGVKKISIR